ncbi:MAG: type II toxin-antitoxin system MqsA family antitoxin [Desulfamplus sp.]|nr:type II toxin-antitoxin system MqsA family antitoxin [Desulfamplus sp.]
METKWNGQACPMCRVGTLHDGIKTITQDYKGHTFTSEIQGAFCNSCDEGFVEFDEAEETAWLDFRDLVDASEAAELARDALSRYERGKKRSVSTVINLFRLIDRHPELLGYLKTG